MKILSVEGRQRPLSLPAWIVPSLSSGRVRRLMLPLPPWSAAVAGDVCWVREACSVGPSRDADRTVRLRYGGEARASAVAWPVGIPKPPLGLMTADRMPVHLSRFTLLVESASVIPISDVPEEVALSAGITIDGNGFGCIGQTFMAPFEEVGGACLFLYERMHGEHLDPSTPIALLEFSAVQRNIASLFLETTGAAP